MLAVSNLLQFVIQKNIPLSTVRILHEMSTNISYRKIPVISPGLIQRVLGGLITGLQPECYGITALTSAKQAARKQKTPGV